MSESALRGPQNAVKTVEHPVADVANAARLAAAIPERPEVLARLHNRHVLSARDLDPETPAPGAAPGRALRVPGPPRCLPPGRAHPHQRLRPWRPERDPLLLRQRLVAPGWEHPRLRGVPVPAQRGPLRPGRAGRAVQQLRRHRRAAHRRQRVPGADGRSLPGPGDQRRQRRRRAPDQRHGGPLHPAQVAPGPARGEPGAPPDHRHLRRPGAHPHHPQLPAAAGQVPPDGETRPGHGSALPALQARAAGGPGAGRAQGGVGLRRSCPPRPSWAATRRSCPRRT